MNQYLRSFANMTSLWLIKGLCLTVTSCALVAAPAYAAPAGDEYLPGVPEAAGKGNASGQGSTQGVPSEAGTSASDSAAEPGEGARAEKGGGDDQEEERVAVSSSGSDDDDSGVAETLLDPVVLLLIAGVVIAALGMLLTRRRQEDREDESRTEAPQGPLQGLSRGSKARTPEGEIVAEDKPREQGA